jgi:hypothetical protein
MVARRPLCFFLHFVPVDYIVYKIFANIYLYIYIRRDKI